MMAHSEDTNSQRVWKLFNKKPLGRYALFVVILFCLVGIYAPFLASSKPLVVQYDGQWYFPLFRYLLYKGFYTKYLDIFFNLMIFTAPLAVLSIIFLRRHKVALTLCLAAITVIQGGCFLYCVYGKSTDPAFDPILSKERRVALHQHQERSWAFDLKYMNDYAKLNLALQYQQRFNQQQHLEKYTSKYAGDLQGARLFGGIPSLWQMQMENEKGDIHRLKVQLEANKNDTEKLRLIQSDLQYILDRKAWILLQLSLLHYEVMPLVRPFHWEDDAGGDQTLNHYISFLDLTRINRKDLAAALIFGVRISLVVGVLAVALAMAIGLPIGSVSGYYGGNFDIVVNRLLEVLEGMPIFFMLLMVVAILQSKSIFLVIGVIGLFGWTSFTRYIRGEFFKQRNLPYIEACRAQGFPDRTIIFSHIFPNAIPPVLTLLPFAIMGAITSEASLSFLGLGEEGSCSWGVLMDEGRAAFPGESYLLWPPAILLTLLLVAIAMVGDALRDALDPKMS